MRAIFRPALLKQKFVSRRCLDYQILLLQQPQKCLTLKGRLVLLEDHSRTSHIFVCTVFEVLDYLLIMLMIPVFKLKILTSSFISALIGLVSAGLQRVITAPLDRDGSDGKRKRGVPCSPSKYKMVDKPYQKSFLSQWRSA